MVTNVQESFLSKIRLTIETLTKSVILFFSFQPKMRLFKRDDDYKAFANEKEEKFAILKNVFLISFGFTLLFTAYNSAAALQSSVNKVRRVFSSKNAFRTGVDFKHTF